MGTTRPTIRGKHRMSRKKLPPRLYFDENRQEWIVRFGERFKRTSYYGRASEEKAQAVLRRYTNLWRDERTVYFITCLEENFPVKIGSAVDLSGRLSVLATAMPWQPVLLASFNGDRTDESKLHAKFSQFRMRGEWFRRVPEITDFAASVRKFESLRPPIDDHLSTSRAISAGELSVPISVPSEKEHV
jgi:hypothetical protein